MANPPSTSQGLAHFTPLNPSVYLHRPPTTTSSSSANDPDLILLLGWMSATPRHISKYTAAYEKLYPSSQILAVTTMIVDAVFSTTATNAKRLEPVLEILYSLPPDAKILLHFVSNGGLFTATVITNTYKAKIGRALHIQAMVLDSTPGRATFARTVSAMSVGLPKNPVLYFLGQNIFRFLYVVYGIGYFVSGRDDFVDTARRDILDLGGRRLYIYSKEDDMVDWQAVESHAKEAEEKGYEVQLERFEGSGHAAHMLRDKERYWGAVGKLWDGA